MKLLEINVVCGIKSTGRITTTIAKEYEEQGYEVKVVYGREQIPEQCRDYAVKIGNKADVVTHALISRIFDNTGFNSIRVTKRFIKWAEEFSPDIVWLHNLHGYYINIELLFNWIKSRPNMKVYWTLHDCWAFTGHCTHFTVVGCDKWKSHCNNCPQKKSYPSSYFVDSSSNNWEHKKRLFSGIDNLQIYTPSVWLKRKIEDSFLKEYPVEVRPNTIDYNIFKYKENNFRIENHISNDKIMVISVASSWTKSKGLDDLIKISTMLDSGKFVVMAVGLSKKQLRTIPSSLLGVGLTDINMLVDIYSSANILVSVSKEETFGLTILEAAACGTKAIVYKDTACEEVAMAHGGIAVEQTPEAVCEAIISML